MHKVNFEDLLGASFPSSPEEFLRLAEQETLPLLPAENYPEGGFSFAQNTLGLALSRDRYIPEYGFVLLTKETVDALVELLQGKKVLEVGSGGGFLAHTLSERGVNIMALDQTTLESENPKYYFSKVWKLDIVGDFHQVLPGDYDVVLLSWPDMGTSFANEVAAQMKEGQVLVYQGEWQGCTADSDFFEQVGGENWYDDTEVARRLNEHHRRFPGIKDSWHASACVRGGDGDKDGGLKDAAGNLRGHYWVEGTAANGDTFIADITADQFGYPPVVVLSLEEGRSLYVSGDQAVVDAHVAAEEEQIALRAAR
jgi:hypothetical protein